MLLFPSTSVEAAGEAWDSERWWRVGRQLKNRPVIVLTNGTTIFFDTDCVFVALIEKR
jgi:hypothetical protein